MYESFVKKLSPARRNFIVEHIDGPRLARAAENEIRSALLSLEVIQQSDEAGNPVRRHGSGRIKFTMLTDHGREALALILAGYAEALVRAGCLEPDAVPLTIVPSAVETVETRRRRGYINHLVERTEA